MHNAARPAAGTELSHEHNFAIDGHAPAKVSACDGTRRFQTMARESNKLRFLRLSRTSQQYGDKRHH
jgi:hypothetical protein